MSRAATPSWASRRRDAWRELPASRRDALVSAVLTVLSLLTLVLEPQNALRGVERSADWLAVALTLLITVPLAWRRRFPLATLTVAGAAVVPLIVLSYAAIVSELFVLFALGAAARCTGRRTAVVLAVIANLVAFGILEFAVDDELVSLLAIIAALVAATAPVVIGDAFRVQAELVEQVRTHALRLDELRDADVHRGVAEERVRMARDIHDVVGHHLASITLRIGAGRQVTAYGQEGALSALEDIDGVTRQALDETRRMLTVLRDGEAAALAPAPRLSGLADLLERVREAGIPAELEVTGTPRELGAMLEGAGFRIVQEALTNVARHARPAGARVRVHYGPRELELRVDDDGRPARGAEPAPAGNGLVGMRERAALLGGSVMAGPREDGGWSVAAILPVEPD